MMARQFESGFYLVERCRRELPLLARYFPTNSAMSAALHDLSAAAAAVERQLERLGKSPSSAGASRDA
jgi:hypothetical protein